MVKSQSVLAFTFTIPLAAVPLSREHLSSKMSSEKDKYQKLIQDYPKLLSKVQYGISCGDGWFVLLRGLCALIEHEIEHLPVELQEQVYAVQIKQKFGGLRFYMEQSTPKIDGAIALAEELSNNTCESCGSMNAGHKQVGGWIATLCDEHHKAELAALKERNRQWREEEKARKAKKAQESK